jgi:hypothetical protein
MVGLEVVQAGDELRQRLCDAERKQPVEADVEGLAGTPAHVRRRRATNECEPQPGEARPHAGPVGAAQEHREAVRPAGAVVYEHCLPSRRAARGHHALVAEVELVALDPVEVLEQLVEV